LSACYSIKRKTEFLVEIMTVYTVLRKTVLR